MVCVVVRGLLSLTAGGKLAGKGGGILLSEASYKVLVRYREGPIEVDPDGLSKREQWLCTQKFIEPCSFKNLTQGELKIVCRATAYQITVAGEDALAEFEKVHDQESKSERQQRFQNKVSVAQVLVPAITFILGLLVEHFAGVIEFALDLFR